jgi:hypothetical protein
MNQSGSGMTERVVHLAETLEDITQGEEIVRFMNITGTQPELCDLPSVEVLQGMMEEAKDCYRQQLRSLSREELRALGTLI